MDGLLDLATWRDGGPGGVSLVYTLSGAVVQDLATGAMEPFHVPAVCEDGVFQLRIARQRAQARFDALRLQRTQQALSQPVSSHIAKILDSCKPLVRLNLLVETVNAALAGASLGRLACSPNTAEHEPKVCRFYRCLKAANPIQRQALLLAAVAEDGLSLNEKFQKQPALSGWQRELVHLCVEQICAFMGATQNVPPALSAFVMESPLVFQELLNSESWVFEKLLKPLGQGWEQLVRPLAGEGDTQDFDYSRLHESSLLLLADLIALDEVANTNILTMYLTAANAQYEQGGRTLAARLFKRGYERSFPTELLTKMACDGAISILDVPAGAKLPDEVIYDGLSQLIRRGEHLGHFEVKYPDMVLTERYFSAVADGLFDVYEASFDGSDFSGRNFEQGIVRLTASIICDHVKKNNGTHRNRVPLGGLGLELGLLELAKRKEVPPDFILRMKKVIEAARNYSGPDTGGLINVIEQGVPSQAVIEALGAVTGDLAYASAIKDKSKRRAALRNSAGHTFGF